MDVESYETVHQLVSTVRGRLRDDVTTVGALRALFPAGSMTGAPKLRTMQVIEEVEADAARVRTPARSAGSSGDGRADLGVVIRSLMTAGDGALPARHRRRHHGALRRRRGVGRVAAGRPSALLRASSTLTPDSAACAREGRRAPARTPATTRARS